ncbi:nickel pincer cofactor biosynthesis protein LarC [Sulfurospirillum diekertiae]|uniref:Putative nickel insertion protein n=1 Tax=Sulfurospirillum diekertiae TaxID=1854492 RepID=A0A6G9VMV6_9BACT|nr:nickel pincer cofactor biosynthesis protein LarC [Sulfurospirillum diekertiae]QIR74821.1 nickel pincer cofactor biosynthesis protein LarC [Sulfurospirillum diekertiae]QIR77485.1 nickel pincer cofactor biosynthesis protein LarC [Sulfurospirillum diekertiae]
MRVLYYDCLSGISGDMNLGALLDVGVEEAYLRQELSKLSLDSAFELVIQKASKMGIGGTKVTVKLTPQWHIHAHHHEHRTFKSIEAIINNSTLSPSIKERSLKMFWMVAMAEGKIHGKEPQEVGFHEVGAVDSIVDIVGAAICLEALHVKKIMASKIELGGGFVQCTHGMLPVPAPATLEILQNVPVTLGRVTFETTTPTGAAIIKANVDVYEKMPSLLIEKIGYGIGHKDFSIPNVLRVFLGEEEEAALLEEVVLETNIDDMSPEILAYVQEKLFEAGAKDVYTTAITTKKNRLGVKLSVLVSQQKEAKAMEIIFAETSSIGLRRSLVHKIMLEREMKRVGTPFGEISVKCVFLQGKMLKYKAEYEECKQAALKHNVPILKIYESVTMAMKDKKDDSKI